MLLPSQRSSSANEVAQTHNQSCKQSKNEVLSWSNKFWNTLDNYLLVLVFYYTSQTDITVRTWLKYSSDVVLMEGM